MIRTYNSKLREWAKRRGIDKTAYTLDELIELRKNVREREVRNCPTELEVLEFIRGLSRCSQ